MCKKVDIFTDGSCLGNPGPGGYGIILCYNQHRKMFSAGYKRTSNNRMELMAAIIALELLKTPCQIVLSTDSQYIRKGITQWIYIWKSLGWKKTNKQSVKNLDLWQRLDAAIHLHTRLRWDWIKGHSGHPENESCHKLARNAARKPYLEDIGYKEYAHVAL